jgi:hypothetical protein
MNQCEAAGSGTWVAIEIPAGWRLQGEQTTVGSAAA